METRTSPVLVGPRESDLVQRIGRTPGATSPAQGNVLVGTLVDWTDEGLPIVKFHDGERIVTALARSTVPLKREDAGRDATLLFERADPSRPIVVGLLQGPVEPEPRRDAPQQAEIDGERIVLTGQREIVLRCGKASITLTRAGKILIRGAYLLNRSSGVNRIKGGSVQIN